MIPDGRLLKLYLTALERGLPLPSPLVRIS